MINCLFKLIATSRGFACVSSSCYPSQQPVERSLISGIVWKFFYQLSGNIADIVFNSIQYLLNVMFTFTLTTTSVN